MKFKQVQSKLASSEASSKEILDYYISNIDTFSDKHRLVVALSPTKEKDSALLDYEKKGGHPRSFLHGLPILVSDLIALKNLAYTGGVKILDYNYVEESATVIKSLKKHGLLVFGKTNVYTLANYLGIEDLFLPPLSMDEKTTLPASLIALKTKLAPVTMDIDIKGEILKGSFDLGLTTIKLSHHLYHHKGLIIPNKSSSLTISCEEVYGVAFLLNIIASKQKLEIHNLKNHNYVMDLINQPFNLKIGCDENNLSFLKEHGLSAKIVNAKLKSKIIEQELTLNNNLFKVKEMLYSLDSFLDNKHLDLIVLDNIPNYALTLINPSLTLTIPYYGGLKRFYIISKTYHEHNLLTLASFLENITD